VLLPLGFLAGEVGKGWGAVGRVGESQSSEGHEGRFTG
jgi:hypothetical protein